MMTQGLLVISSFMNDLNEDIQVCRSIKLRGELRSCIQDSRRWEMVKSSKMTSVYYLAIYLQQNKAPGNSSCRGGVI